VQRTLSEVASNFSIAAAFGNVHGVYKPGNVKLNPGILQTHQVRVRALTTDASMLRMRK
jgi:fructose-bisphosphate aldolase, class II